MTNTSQWRGEVEKGLPGIIDMEVYVHVLSID